MPIDKDLQLFGLNEAEQLLYILLARKGWSTVLQISKHCQIKRTTLYRIIESMVDKGYLNTQIGEKTTFYNIAPPVNSFKTTIFELEEKIKKMKLSIEKINEYTQKLITSKLDETSLFYYKGISGLKQAEWMIRVSKTNIELLVFDSELWANVVGNKFAEELRQQVVEKNNRIRSISNNEGVIMPAGTTLLTTNKEYTTNLCRHRIISEKIMKMKQDIFIMPDSLIFWGVEKNDEMAIEIKNKDYADMMKQIFESIWDKAKAIDNFGQRFKA